MDSKEQLSVILKKIEILEEKIKNLETGLKDKRDKSVWEKHGRLCGPR